VGYLMSWKLLEHQPLCELSIYIPPQASSARVSQDESREESQGWRPSVQGPKATLAPVGVPEEAHMVRLGEVLGPVMLVGTPAIKHD
jgi:hypothetical protein